jgi:hypothetical protein
LVHEELEEVSMFNAVEHVRLAKSRGLLSVQAYFDARAAVVLTRGSLFLVSRQVRAV